MLLSTISAVLPSVGAAVDALQGSVGVCRLPWTYVGRRRVPCGLADFSCDFRVTRMALGQSARFFCWVMFLHFLGTLEVALRPVASRQVNQLPNL